jgi:hypothetical protein
MVVEGVSLPWMLLLPSSSSLPLPPLFLLQSFSSLLFSPSSSLVSSSSSSSFSSSLSFSSESSSEFSSESSSESSSELSSESSSESCSESESSSLLLVSGGLKSDRRCGLLVAEIGGGAGWSLDRVRSGGAILMPLPCSSSSDLLIIEG